MAKLIITTQTYENYGTETDAYWKPKGGSDYVVLNVNINNVKAVVESVKDQCECSNPFFTEHILGWEIVADDYLTEFEQQQLDYEGQIRFPAKVLQPLEAA